MSGKAALHARYVFAPDVHRLEAVSSSRLRSLWDAADQGQAANKKLAETLLDPSESCDMTSIHDQRHRHTLVPLLQILAGRAGMATDLAADSINVGLWAAQMNFSR